jgi:hypothetical protein
VRNASIARPLLFIEFFRTSVGHLIVDALAQRFRIRMTTNKALGGITGHSNALIGDLNIDLTLFKPSRFGLSCYIALANCARQSLL